MKLALAGLALAAAAVAAASADPCAGRSPCRVVETMKAGTDGEGRPLTVERVHAFELKHGHDDVELPAADADECKKAEYWLLGPDKPKKLVDICNDGYGAAMMGEDEVEVTPNQLKHSRTGGSAWLWHVETVLQLSPLTPESETRIDTDRNGPEMRETTWSWSQFAGSGRVAHTDCDADGNLPRVLDAPTHEARWVAIPRVSPPSGLLAGAWKKTDLGGCAVLVDGTNGEGFVLFGDQHGAADSSMKLLLAGDTLLAEVHDDRIVTGASSWLGDDHLEVWIAAGDNSPRACVDAAKPEPVVQWGIRLSDGKVFPGFGDKDLMAVAPVTAERADGPGGSVRLKIKLTLGESDRITVVYSDVDDPLEQAKLTGTSELSFGKAWSLGLQQPVHADQAICVATKGRLDPKITKVFKPGEAAIPAR